MWTSARGHIGINFSCNSTGTKYCFGSVMRTVEKFFIYCITVWFVLYLCSGVTYSKQAQPLGGATGVVAPGQHAWGGGIDSFFPYPLPPSQPATTFRVWHGYSSLYPPPSGFFPWLLPKCPCFILPTRAGAPSMALGGRLIQRALVVMLQQM